MRGLEGIQRINVIIPVGGQGVGKDAGKQEDQENNSSRGAQVLFPEQPDKKVRNKPAPLGRKDMLRIQVNGTAGHSPST